VPEAAPLPELTGLTTQAATAELQRFRTERGVRLNWIVQQVAVSNPASWNRVVATNPPPGSLVSEGETITIIIGIRP
jgi:beta-lactam-binding protein with PASTA domain